MATADKTGPIRLTDGTRLEYGDTSRPVHEDDAPRASLTGTSFRVHEDSTGIKLIAEAREAEPGSEREAALARKIQQIEDIHEGIIAVRDLAAGFAKIIGGGRWAAGFLAAAILAHPVIGSLIPGQRDAKIVEQLEALNAKADNGREERRALAAWIWQKDQCERGLRPCPEQPPATVRLMIAQDEIDQGK